MNYNKANLLENETVLMQIEPHWVVFIKPIFWLVITLFILLAGPFFELTRFQLLPNTPHLYQFFAVITFGIAFFRTIKTYLDYSSSKLVITNKRFVLQNGFFKQITIEVLLIKIEKIEVIQTVFGRLMNYGKLKFPNQSSENSWININIPQRTRNILQQEILKLQA